MRLDDRLYVETDDARAVCGIRGPEKLTVHHSMDTVKGLPKYQAVMPRNVTESLRLGPGARGFGLSFTSTVSSILLSAVGRRCEIACAGLTPWWSVIGTAHEPRRLISVA